MVTEYGFMLSGVKNELPSMSTDSTYVYLDVSERPDWPPSFAKIKRRQKSCRYKVILDLTIMQGD